MPLIKPALESKLRIQLKTFFLNPQTKLALKRRMDGGPLKGTPGQAKGINQAIRNTKIASAALSTVASPAATLAWENALKKIHSNEWANAISDSICEWMADEVADELAKIFASEIDSYIKSATIIVQPGIAVATAGSPVAQTGTTVAPSAPATII